MGLIAAGRAAQVDGYIGYYKPYATSHDDFDREENFQEEVRNAARSLVRAVRLLRGGAFKQPDAACATRGRSNSGLLRNIFTGLLKKKPVAGCSKVQR